MRHDQTGADLGAGAPQPHPEPAEPEEEFQSPMSVAGIGPGGRPYGRRAPSDENPAADPGSPPDDER
jgi:hypothetical protein